MSSRKQVYSVTLRRRKGIAATRKTTKGWSVTKAKWLKKQKNKDIPQANKIVPGMPSMCPFVNSNLIGLRT